MRRTFSCLAAVAVLALPLHARAVVPPGAPVPDGIVDASSSRKKAKTGALVAGGVAGGLLLGTVIANANRPQQQVVVVQPPPPPPVVVQPPPVAQPQPLPPNCQAVLQTIQVQGIPQPQQAVSIACRRPDGSWEYR